MFLFMNGYVFCAPRKEAVEFTVKVASSKSCTNWTEISVWIRKFALTFSDYLSLEEKPELIGKLKRIGVLEEDLRKIDSLVKSMFQILRENP